MRVRDVNNVVGHTVQYSKITHSVILKSEEKIEVKLEVESNRGRYGGRREVE